MRKYFYISSIFLTLIACKSTKPVVSEPSPSAEVPEANKTSAVLWQQTAAEYEALCFQAFNIAKDRLTAAQQVATDGNLNAVIMDLDETVIDNSPYNGYLILDDQEFNQSSWKEWVMMAKADLVPGALEFINYANELNIPIYYISNRSIDLIEPTKQLLQSKGIRVTEENLLLQDGPDGSKLTRREFVNSKYNVLMLIGDNLADFHDTFEQTKTISSRKDAISEFQDQFGEKFIILPNVMYGDWDKALDIEDPNAIKNRGRGSIKYLERY